MIIIITGTSSSGKSSVAQFLQPHLGEGWLQFSVDGYLSMLGDKFLGLHPSNPDVCTPNNICYAKKHVDGTYEIMPGKLCSQLYSTIPDVLEIIARQGFNIIVDSLVDTKEVLEIYRKKCAPFGVFFVYLDVDDNILEQREQARGDRLNGSARHWLKTINCRDSADLIIDTSTLSIEEVSRILLDKLPLR